MQMLLRLLNSKELDLVPSVGNRGDGLINQGAYQFLERNGVKYRVLKRGEDSRGENLVVIGAGGFCKPYKHRIGDTQFYYGKYKNIFVVSVTFDVEEPEVAMFLRNLPQNVTIICRDKTSFSICLKYTDKVFFDHDLAFQFDYEPYKKEGIGVIHSFRADDERTELRSDVDLSKGPKIEWEELVKGCAEYQEIHTNRLHTAIAGAMLGKDVHLYPNSYHKNRSVWEYSLKGRGVSWQ